MQLSSQGAAGSQRLRRVEHEIVRELSELIHEHLKDPRVGFVTIVGCTVSPDLRTARVYASPMGSPRAASQTMRGLESATGFLSTELAKRLTLRRSFRRSMKARIGWAILLDMKSIISRSGTKASSSARKIAAIETKITAIVDIPSNLQTLVAA